MIWNNDDHKKRALKSFAAFIIECKHEVLDSKTNKFKCKNCYGSGRVVSPSAYNDPVEGYKMADRIDCYHCRGTGESDEKTWRAVYKEEKTKFAVYLKDKREKETLRKSALKKLTPEEKRALNLH